MTPNETATAPAVAILGTKQCKVVPAVAVLDAKTIPLG
jgi:hypothetical protein